MEEIPGCSNSNSSDGKIIEVMNDSLPIISDNDNSIVNEEQRIKRIKLVTSTSHSSPKYSSTKNTDTLGQEVDNNLMAMSISKADNDTNKDSSFVQPQQRLYEFEIRVYNDGGSEPFFISERTRTEYPILSDFFKNHGQDFNQICQNSGNSSVDFGDIELQSEKEIMIRSGGLVSNQNQAQLSTITTLSMSTISSISQDEGHSITHIVGVEEPNDNHDIITEVEKEDSFLKNNKTLRKNRKKTRQSSLLSSTKIEKSVSTFRSASSIASDKQYITSEEFGSDENNKTSTSLAKGRDPESVTTTLTKKPETHIESLSLPTTESTETEIEDVEVNIDELEKSPTIFGFNGPTEMVFARWNDRNYYSGKIIEKGRLDMWVIAYEDGFNSAASEAHIIPMKLLGVGIKAIYSPDGDGLYQPSIATIIGQKKINDKLFYAIECADRERPIFCERRHLYLKEVEARKLRKEYEAEIGANLIKKGYEVSFVNLIHTPRSLTTVSSASKSNSKQPEVNIRKRKIVGGVSDEVVFKSTPKTRRVSKKMDPKKLNLTSNESKSSTSKEIAIANCDDDPLIKVSPDFSPKASPPSEDKSPTRDPKSETGTKEILITSSTDELEIATTDDCLKKGCRDLSPKANPTPAEEPPSEDSQIETVPDDFRLINASMDKLEKAVKECKMDIEAFIDLSTNANTSSADISFTSPQNETELEETLLSSQAQSSTETSVELLTSSAIDELEMATTVDCLKQGCRDLTPKASTSSEEKSPIKDQEKDIDPNPNDDLMLISASIDELEKDCMMESFPDLSPPAETFPSEDSQNETEILISSAIDEQLEMPTDDDDCMMEGFLNFSPKASSTPEKKSPNKDTENEYETAPDTKEVPAVSPHLIEKPSASLSTLNEDFKNVKLFQGLSFYISESGDSDPSPSVSGLSISGPVQRYNKAEYTERIEKNGGLILDFVGKEKKSCYRSHTLFLICNNHARTIKYIYGLAAGIPLLSYKWIDECIEEDAIVPWSKYELNAGWSIEQHKIIPSHIEKPLKDLKIYIVSIDEIDLYKYWKHVLNKAQAKLLKPQPSDSEKLLPEDTEIIIANCPLSKAMRLVATERDIPVVFPEWLVQTIITGEIAGYARYKNCLVPLANEEWASTNAKTETEKPGPSSRLSCSKSVEAQAPPVPAVNLTGLNTEESKETASSGSVPTATAVNINSTGTREGNDDSSDSEIEILGQGKAELVSDSDDEAPGSPEIIKVPNYAYDTSDESE